MEEFDEYKKMLVGKTLTNLYFTKQDGPYDYMPGIFPAYYFFTIMELDNEKKFRFSNDNITEWENDEPIIKLSNQNWDLPKNLVFKGQKIVELTKDEYQHVGFPFLVHFKNIIILIHLCYLFFKAEWNGGVAGVELSLEEE